MGDLTLKIDEVHIPVFYEVRSKQRKSMKGTFRLARAQPNAPSFESVLLDGCHKLVSSHGAVCSKSGESREQHPSLPGVGLMMDHRNPSLRLFKQSVFRPMRDRPFARVLDRS